MRRFVRVLLSWEISVIQPLRWITLPRLPQPFQARISVRTNTAPKPSDSFRLTLMLPNQLFIQVPREETIQGEAVRRRSEAPAIGKGASVL